MALTYVSASVEECKGRRLLDKQIAKHYRPGDWDNADFAQFRMRVARQAELDLIRNRYRQKIGDNNSRGLWLSNSQRFRNFDDSVGVSAWRISYNKLRRDQRLELEDLTTAPGYAQFQVCPRNRHPR